MSSPAIKEQLRQAINTSQLEIAQPIIEHLITQSIQDIELLELCIKASRYLYQQERAVQFSGRALQINPDDLQTNITYFNELLRWGKLEDAQAVITQKKFNPDNNINLRFQKAKLLYLQKEYEQAKHLLEGLVEKHPGFAAAHMELAHTYLMLGEYRVGWQEYQWRFKLPATKNMFPTFKMPIWQGQKIEHLLLIADQGYGDCFQFSRYLPLVQQCCKKVSLMRSQELSEIFNRPDFFDHTFNNWKDTPLTSAYCTLSELPKIFNTEINSIPCIAPVFSIATDTISTWRTKVSSKKLNVGFAWSGRVEFENNNLRSLHLGLLKPLLNMEGVEAYSLQKGFPATQIQSEGLENSIRDLSPDLNDFTDTAAAMQALDLIITSDTSVAHLAASLGKPCWVLLHYSPDWRWGNNEKTCDWYSSVRLFKQESISDWAQPIQQCQQALELLISQEKNCSTSFT